MALNQPAKGVQNAALIRPGIAVPPPIPKSYGHPRRSQRSMQVRTLRRAAMSVDLGGLLDTLPGLVWTALPDGRLDYVGRRWLDYTGLSLETASGDGWTRAVHSDDLPRLLEEWNSIIASRRTGEVEARMRRHDGVYRWFRFQACPMPAAATAEGAGWCGMNIDIDDARRAEGKLAAERRLLELMATGAPVTETLEAACREIEALAPDSACSVLLTSEGEEVIWVGGGPSLPDDCHTNLEGPQFDPSAGPCSLAAALNMPVIASDMASDPRFSGSASTRAIVAQGYRSCWAMPVLSRGGEVIGVLAIWRRTPEGPPDGEPELVDRFAQVVGLAIERGKGEEALRASEAELRQAYKHLTEGQQLSRTGSFTLDPRSQEQVWSQELGRICGVPPGGKLDLEILRGIIHPDDLQTFDAVVAASSAGVDPEVKFRIVTARGVKHLHAVAHRVTGPEGHTLFHGAIHDITEATLAEQALSRARAELAHVSRVSMMGALTASIAHEVNQPLAGIITNASTCLRMLAADPPDLQGARATAQRTIRDGNRAADVIQRLRALFARKAPDLERLDLNDGAREVLALSESELQRRRISVRRAFAEDLPVVSGDRIQLQQVILNLVLNAADAMSAVEDRPRDMLLTTGRGPGDSVQLSVRDNGMGLGGEPAEALFQAFHTTKPDGMGIGLSISRSIVEAHGGKLVGASNDGPGATFTFSIPCVPDEAPATRTPTTALSLSLGVG